MAANIIIIALILGYGAFLLYRRVQKKKQNGGGSGCGGG